MVRIKTQCLKRHILTQYLKDSSGTLDCRRFRKNGTGGNVFQRKAVMVLHFHVPQSCSAQARDRSRILGWGGRLTNRANAGSLLKPDTSAHLGQASLAGSSLLPPPLLPDPGGVGAGAHAASAHEETVRKRRGATDVPGSPLPLHKSAMISEIPLLHSTALQCFPFVSSFNFFVNLTHC